MNFRRGFRRVVLVLAAAGAIPCAPDAQKVDGIEIRWIGGRIDIFKDVPVDQLPTITEGTGNRYFSWLLSSGF
ncbi:MAG: hypothetical protein JSU70_07400 [Phycisphaerales bacterium]|nr:MAG: hypothetical protein JSU70_07400 [Phycisphaerales bacterium]